MPRAPRIDIPGLPQHVRVRGNDRSNIFSCDEDHLAYLGYVDEARKNRGCDIHAFVLMDRRFNERCGRTGTLYEGRFKSSLVETQTYFLACMRYIELNPVRAGMVDAPREFPWSSFHQNASGEPRGMLTPHAEYLALGRDAQARRAAYLGLFEEEINEEQLRAIRESMRQGRALGSERYCEALAGTLRRTVKVVARGRPPQRSA